MKKANFRTKAEMYSRLADIVNGLDKDSEDAVKTLGELRKKYMDKIMTDEDYKGSWEHNYDLDSIKRYESIVNAVAIIRDELEDLF